MGFGVAETGLLFFFSSSCICKALGKPRPMAARGTAGLSVSELCKHFQLEDLGANAKGAAAGAKPAHKPAQKVAQSNAVSEPQPVRKRVSRSMLDSYFAQQSDVHRAIMEQLLWAEQQRSDGEVSEDSLDAVFHVADLEHIAYSESDWGKFVVSVQCSAVQYSAEKAGWLAFRSPFRSINLLLHSDARCW
jgi:hypothetical protein